MAVTNEQVLAEISSYRAEQNRPCPAKHLTDKFGDDALDIIAALKKDGTLIGKRGRTGGLVPASETSAAAPADADAGESVADQFAELAAKLAANEGEAASG